MRRDNRRLITHFIIFVVFQLPLLYRFVLFDQAFAFFYVGFLLLLPVNQPVITSMTIGFLIGLIIDIFSNTPGLHASASVILMFFRIRWLTILKGVPDELTELQVYTFGFRSFLLFLFPLIFVHHLMIFTLENAGFNSFGLVMKRVLSSAVLTTALIILSSYLMNNKRRRL